MSTLSLAEKLRQKLNMKPYLHELAALVGRPVQPNELGSLTQAAAIRQAGQKFGTQPSRTCDILFSEKSSKRFKGFLKRLHDENPSSVYIWTPRTIDCGALQVPSLEVLNFDFDFSINNEGILVFLSNDLEDRLLLDFSLSPSGEQSMKVETQGANWGKVAY